MGEQGRLSVSCHGDRRIKNDADLDFLQGLTDCVKWSIRSGMKDQSLEAELVSYPESFLALIDQLVVEVATCDFQQATC